MSEASTQSAPASVHSACTTPQPSENARLSTFLGTKLVGEERKQSASDLQSRLKTRKLLGVGEVNGDTIYKSKISQLLGINESLYVQSPRGLLLWNSVNTVYFYLYGAICVFLPSVGSRLDLGITLTSPESYTIMRAYGVLLFSFGLIHRSLLATRESRMEVSNLLLTTSILYTGQVLVTLFSAEVSNILVVMRMVGLGINLAFHAVLDPQGGIYRQCVRCWEELPSFSMHGEEEDQTAKKDK